MARTTRFLLAASIAAALIVGCARKPKSGSRVRLPERYTRLPEKKVPDFLKDTILEKCDLINTEPFLVSGYSVVVNLDNTGDGQAPNLVREYIVKEMFKHKWGSVNSAIDMP